MKRLDSDIDQQQQLAAGGRRRVTADAGPATASSPDAIIGGDDSVPTLPASTRRALRRASPRSAFTMAELLIVIALIVLLLGLAVPAFNLLSGGKSIEGATNQISAALGRARAEAIGLQKVTGVLFFIDPKTQRRSMAIVQAVDPLTDHANSGAEVWLDVVDENDFLPLPAGIGVQVIDDCAMNATNVRQDDGYIGFNTEGRGFSESISSSPDTLSAVSKVVTATPYGGAILFDGNGQLVSMAYGFRCQTVTNTGTFTASRIGQLFYANPSAALDFVPGPPATPTLVANKSAVGLVLFEQDVFKNNGGTDEDPQMKYQPAGTYNGAEPGEETWLDNNSTPLMINRYNGTLVRGE